MAVNDPLESAAEGYVETTACEMARVEGGCRGCSDTAGVAADWLATAGVEIDDADAEDEEEEEEDEAADKGEIAAAAATSVEGFIAAAETAEVSMDRGCTGGGESVASGSNALSSRDRGARGSRACCCCSIVVLVGSD